jgi:hypothetical protein
MTEPHTTTEDFYDTLEPEEASAYRQAALRLYPVIMSAVGHVLAAENVEIGLTQVRFALGIEARSMRDLASLHRCTPAGISRGAKEFQTQNNLPTPPCMKSERASAVYRRTRLKQLTNTPAKPPEG